jgi:Uma2 family endonuclease
MTAMKLRGPATIEDLLKRPNDGRKYELVDGEILMSPTGSRHAEIVGKLSTFWRVFWRRIQ